MMHDAPNWLQRWFGVSGAPAGEGTVWSLEHSWPLAPWLTVLLLAALAAFVVLLYSRESGGASRAYRGLLAALRLAALAIVLFMLAEYFLSLTRTGLPALLVLLDDSASMSIADRYSDEKLRSTVAERLAGVELTEPTRLNLAKSLLLGDDARVLRELDQRYRLKFYFVAAAARQHAGTLDELREQLQTASAAGESSRLGEGVRTALNDLRGTPPTAVVLLTDGIVTDGPPLDEAATYARRKGVPVFAVALGDERPVRDLALTDLLVDEVVFVDDIINFDLKLTASGYQGQRVRITLRDEHSPAVLAQLEVQLDSDNVSQRLQLPYRPTTVGEDDFVIEVEPLEGELRTENNRQKRHVSVRKEQIRVLLVQAYPSYEFRYLKNMLGRDSTIKLDTFLQEADPEYADLDATALRVFPVRREELFAYDVIVLGDVNPVFLSSSTINQLVEFVTDSGKGGGLIIAAGPMYLPLAYRDTPLAQLFPLQFDSSVTAAGQAQTEAFRPLPTELGAATPFMNLGDSTAETAEIWRTLPPLYWCLESTGLKPAARVLAAHPSRVGADGQPLPIIALQYVGAGKVLFHATDETWRWRFRVGDVYFARYWVQAIRFLSRTKLLGQDRAAELTTDRREYQRGETARLRVQFVDERQAPTADNGVTVMVERQGSDRRSVQLHRSATARGVFEGALAALAEGDYHAWVATPSAAGNTPSADFAVVAPPGEFAQTQMQAGILRAASEATGGHYYSVATMGSLLDDLPPGRQVPVETLPRIVLWNRWPLVALFLALVGSEWLLRKRKGML
ncbi:MAG: VWA domain-containing protein [Pirellulales bacterium]|nr:VWA domain-containing protein [Pirellulales bacterium]